jgi:tetratricopeptide (TPR) repeat protein
VIRPAVSKLVLGVWLLALCLRCIYLWQISHAPFFDLRIGDAEAYHLWALRIAGGDWIGQDVFYQAPLYPYFLAGIYRTLGNSVTTVRLIQAIVGASSCALLAAAGVSLFGRRGVLAGLLLAIYPSAVFMDGLLEKSALVTFLTAALLALLAMWPDGAMARRWFGVGIVVGLLALTRENALLLVAPILSWIAIGPVATSKQARLTTALVFLTGFALVLLPVGLRNLAVGHEFHLTTSQFGPNFYIGNHAGAKGTYEALVQGHGSAADERQDATQLAEQATGRKLSPAEVSDFWTTRSLDYIRSQPIDWLKQLARKFALTFNAAELVDTESQAVYADWSWLLQMLQPFDFGRLLGLAALGAALTARSWRRLWFLYALAGTYALSVVVFYVFARYRFPLVPALMILAAGGVLEALAYVQGRQSRKLVVPAAVAVLAVVFAHLPLQSEREARAVHYLNIAASLSKDPARFDDAAAFYKRALGEAPGFPQAHFGLGMLLARAGRPQEAVPYYRVALESWPTDAQTRFNLGLALAASDQVQEASQQLSEALRIRPDDAEMHIAFARVLVSMQRPDLAAQHYQQGLAIQPDNVTALEGLGVALAQLGRPDEAIEKYRRALDLDPRNGDAHNNLGWTLASQGRLDEAVPHFERALALNPADENARKNLDRARQIQQHPQPPSAPQLPRSKSRLWP